MMKRLKLNNLLNYFRNNAKSQKQLYYCGCSYLNKKPSLSLRVTGVSSLSARWCSTDTKPLVVYVGPMRGQIVTVKLLTMFSSVCGVFMIPYILTNGPANGLGFMVAFGSFVSFFTFVTPFLIHMVCKKYVIELTYNEKENSFTSTTFGFFLTKKQLTFTSDDVEVPDLPGMFTTLKAKGKPLLFDPSHFSHLVYYEKLVGIEYPIKSFDDDKEKKS